MHVSTDDLATLLQMQQLDLEAARARKELEALPQRKAILATRTKKRSISEKAAKLADMHSEADRKLSRISDEDAQLAEKQHAVQAEIDSLKGDYRSVESRTKELNGLAKRRVTLEGELNAVGEELSKIEAVQQQVADALASLATEEEAATKVFVEEGGKLKQRASQAEAQSAELAAGLDPKLVDLYQKTGRRTGGVVFSKLSGESCGACRSPINHGRIVDMRTHGNVGTCPNCNRLIIL